MPFPISLNQEEYEALVSLARKGITNADGQIDVEKSRQLETFLQGLEKQSGISRYALWVQWQNAREPLPPNTDFPEKWPPELRAYIALTSRPIARADVDKLLSARASNPVNVLVTKDPAALVGWTDVDAYFK